MKKESIDSIKRKYTDEWVLISDYETDEFSAPLNGVVVAHSKSREEIYNLQMEIDKDLCIYYTGEMPKDMAVMF